METHTDIPKNSDSLEPIREPSHPEKNQFDTANAAFRLLGAVTRTGENHGTERPLSVRRERARLFTEIKSTDDRTAKRSALNEAHQRDEVLRQILNQHTVDINTSEYGAASARYAKIDPPNAEVFDSGKGPIVIIPGISNDIACMDAVAMEAALSGRQVYILGYPGSYMGTVDEDFTEAVERSESYEAHAGFFKNALKSILPDEQNMELWGFSTGGPIVANILSDDENLRKKISDAVLINPAGAVKRTNIGLFSGLAKEGLTAIAHPKTYSAYVLTTGRKDTGRPELPEQKKRKNRIFSSLLKKIRTVSDDWETMRVRDGGTITVVAGDSDDVTLCRNSFSESKKPDNPQVRVVPFPGRHSAPLVNAKQLIDALRDTTEEL